MKVNLIDTHAHIYVPEFDNDRTFMIERAQAGGIKKIIMPAIDSASHTAMLKTEQENVETCFSMMGVHPCSIKINHEEELKIARDHLEKRRFVAIGEIGLDFYWDITYTEQQYKAFHAQIEWALHFNIPIVIHSRDSIDECIKVVAEHQKGNLSGVFHCFSGSSEQAKRIIDLGFYLGIGGVLTFKKSGLDKAIEDIDLSHLVLETDAPYLAPVPFRGKRNECSYIKYIAQKLAEVKNISVEEVAGITTAKAEKLFSL